MKESYLVTRVLRQRSVGVIGGVFLCLVWFALYAVTLEFVALVASDHVRSREGYGALISLWGYPLTMPGAFAISLITLVAGKRWLFLELAPIAAAGVAIVFAFG